MDTRTLGALVFSAVVAAITARGQTPASQGAAAPGPQPPQPSSTTAQAPPKPNTAVIRGRVTSMVTGRPIRVARVVLNSAAGEPEPANRLATTNADGRFEFTSLPPHRYNMTVSKPGYVFLPQSRRYRGPLEITNGQVVENVDFALGRGSVISGRVTDEFGEPVAGVRLQAMRYQYLSGGRRELVRAGAPDVDFFSNDLGEFRIYGLTAGTFIVSAGSNTSTFFTANADGNVTVVGAVTTGRDADSFAPTYFPGTAKVSEAQPVAVVAAQEASASFSLAAVRSTRISVMVRNSSGQPAAGARVWLIPGEGIEETESQNRVAADGSFTLFSVPPGQHVLEVEWTPLGVRTGQAPETARINISTQDRDITNLIAATRAGIPVSGHVRYEGRPMPKGGNPLVVMATTAEFSNTPFDATFTNLQSGPVDEQGRFALHALDGNVLFRTGFLQPPWALKAVLFNGNDVTDVPLSTESLKEISGLEVVIFDKQPKLTGYAHNPRGDLLTSYKVALFPIQRDGGVPMRFMYTSVADSNGRFQIGRLPPGEYEGVATQLFEPWFEWDPDFQKKVRPHAKRFTLHEGETLEVDLPYVE